MGTLAEKLDYLLATKDQIKAAIVAHGLTVPDDATFRSYAEFIGQIVTSSEFALGLPAQYKSMVDHVRENLYTGEFSDLVVFDQGAWRAVSFLMDDFVITDFDPETTEFRATGWVTCGYNVASGTWTVNDWTAAESTGGTYIKNVVYATRYILHLGETLFPIAVEGESGPVVVPSFVSVANGFTITSFTSTAPISVGASVSIAEPVGDFNTYE